MGFIGITLVACLIVAVGFIARFAYEQQAVAQSNDTGDAGIAVPIQEDDNDNDTDNDSVSDDQYDNDDSAANNQYTGTEFDNDRDLLESSGSITGPLPFMRDGSCPDEFPVVGAGGCYAAP